MEPIPSEILEPHRQVFELRTMQLEPTEELCRDDPIRRFVRTSNYDLLDRFIFADDAKRLWELLYRTEQFKTNCSSAFGYWRTCSELLADWEDDPKQTCSEKENELNLISRKAQELAELISESSYLRGIKLIDVRASLDAAIPALTDEEIAEGLYRAPAITKENEEAAVLNGLRRLHGTDGPLPDHEAHAASLLARYYSLGVNDVLRQVAAIADEENQYGPMVSRPHSTHAKRQFVARCLRDVHVGNFGSPMWEAHALACTLILDPNEPLTPDDLRPYCR